MTVPTPTPESGLNTTPLSSSENNSDSNVTESETTPVSNQEPASVSSPDARVKLQTGLHTKARNSNGLGVNNIQIKKIAQPATSPASCSLIGSAYEFMPTGTTFDPPANLTFTYATADIPEGIPENNLSITYWNAHTDQWVAMPSLVDSKTHTVTAQVSHFSVYAIMGSKQPLTEFKISPLTVSPDDISAGEAFNINVQVNNIGSLAGTYELVLKVNDVVELTKEVTVDAGSTQELNFNMAEDTAGTYNVDINGVTQSFEVKSAPTSGNENTSEVNAATTIKVVSWATLGAIICAVFVFFVLMVLALLLYRRRLLRRPR